MRLLFGDSKYSWNIDHESETADNIGLYTISLRELNEESAKEDHSVEESPREKKLRKRSHWVAYATMFVMTVGFSVVLSGVWPYLQHLDGTLTKESLGWVVAANPFGQMIASPIVGYIGNSLGSIRYVCYFTMTSFIMGNLLYSFLPLLKDLWPHSGFHLMILSRFIVGLSSSNVTLCRSYLASSTTQKERTTGISIISAAQSLGFVVGPAIQAVISVTINRGALEFRIAGLVAACLGLVNFILLTPCIFQEYNIAAKEHSMLKERTKQISDFIIPKTDYTALLGVLFGFFMNQFIYVLLETLMEPFLTDQYSWCDDIAVIVTGVVFAFAGILAVGMFIISTRLAKKFFERKLLIFGGFVPISIGVFLFIPWGPGTLHYCPAENSTSAESQLFQIFEPYSSNTADSREINIVPLVSDGYYSNWRSIGYSYKTLDNSETNEKWDGTGYLVTKFCPPDQCYGCPPEQTWCQGHNRLPMSQFIVAYLIVIMGYPFGISMSNAIFSKILGPKPQGFWMGILTSSGSLSRVLGPIFVSYLYTNIGTEVTFSILFVGMLIAIFELSVLYKRLIPMKIIATPTSKQ